MYRPATMLIAFCMSSAAIAGDASRVWSFDLKTPGTYKVQVQHPADSNVPRDTEVNYSFQIGQESQARDLNPLVGQPYIPLIFDILAPKKMRVSITGLPQTVLQRTHVYVFDAASVPPNEYYDPKKNDFMELRQVRAILNQPPDKIDLGRAKIALDKMLDPTIDLEGTLQKLDTMVTKIKAMSEYGSTSTAKLTAIQRYIYQAGAWNEYKPFQ